MATISPGRPGSVTGVTVFSDQLDEPVLGKDVQSRVVLALRREAHGFRLAVPAEDPAAEGPLDELPLPFVDVLGAAENGAHAFDRWLAEVEHEAGEQRDARWVRLDERGAELADPPQVRRDAVFGEVVRRDHQLVGEQRPLVEPAVGDDGSSENDPAVPSAEAHPGPTASP